jgi:hypothetical protein
VEVNAIVQELLQRLACVRGALVEQGVEVTDTSNYILGRWRVERFERGSQLLNAANLSACEDFELTDLLEEASGLSRGEILRRLLLTADIPSARARQEVQDILRIQREQNRLGGLLKKALTERAEKTELRRTLIEVERNGAELRRVIAHLVRSR